MKKYLKPVSTIFLLLLGNALSALSMAGFALPHNMLVAGVTGIGKMVNYYTGFSISFTVGIINVSLFIIGGLLLGKKFAATIALGTFAFPLFLDIFQKYAIFQNLVQDQLLAAICAGVLDGVGLGIVIRNGGSTGGMDVPPIILNNKLGIPIAPVIYGLDLLIFMSQLPISNSESVILGVLYALLYSVVMNKIIVMDNNQAQVTIYSSMNDKINERFMQLGFGATFFKSRSGYIGEDTETLVCVISNRNLNKIKGVVTQIDPKAFMTISSVSEVRGNGFTMMFDDGEYNPDRKKRINGAMRTD